MRYPDGGGLSGQARARREALRLPAAGWFAEGVSVPEVARRLRVSPTAVYGRRQRRCRDGDQALASKGPGGSRCRLDESRLGRLADALDEGPAVDGFGVDQRWTLARVCDLVARMFPVRYTLRGTSYLLGPYRLVGAGSRASRGRAGRAGDHDGAAGGVAGRKTVAAQRDAWICVEDEAGQTRRPAKARTWGGRGRTPVIPVSGTGPGRISIAGLLCVKPGRSRLIYRTIVHRRRTNERRSFAEADYIALPDAAHHHLGGPIVLGWDNVNTHVSAAMRELITARNWLHVIRLAAYAPDLNPTEGVWSHLKRGIGNLAVRGVDDLQTIIKNRLKRIRYRTDLLDGFLTHTGLTLEPDST